MKNYIIVTVEGYKAFQASTDKEIFEIIGSGDDIEMIMLPVICASDMTYYDEQNSQWLPLVFTKA